MQPHRGTTKSPRNINNSSEIQFYQKSTAFLLRRLLFLMLIQEVTLNFKTDLHFTAESAYTLQSAAEDYLVRLFEDSNLCTIHTKCTPIMPKDMQLTHGIRGERCHYRCVYFGVLMNLTIHGLCTLLLPYYCMFYG